MRNLLGAILAVLVAVFRLVGAVLLWVLLVVLVVFSFGSAMIVGGTSRQRN